MACLAGPSFHEGSGSRAAWVVVQLAPSARSATAETIVLKVRMFMNRFVFIANVPFLIWLSGLALCSCNGSKRAQASQPRGLFLSRRDKRQ